MSLIYQGRRLSGGEVTVFLLVSQTRFFFKI